MTQLPSSPLAATSAIQRETLMQPAPAPQGINKEAFLKYMTGIAILSFLFMVTNNGGPVTFFAVFCVGLVVLSPIYYMLRLRIALKAGRQLEQVVRAETEAKLKTFIGAAPAYLDVGVTELNGRAVGTGIALANDRLYVVDAGEVATIPIHAVRSWEWRIAGTPDRVQIVVGRDPRGQMGKVDDAHQDIRDRRAAYLASGMTLRVADVEKPSWRFTTDRKDILERWGEILRQLDEGKLRAA